MNAPLMIMGVIGPWQIAVIVILFLLLFGGKKIPELMKGLGKGIRSFKEGVNDVKDEINKPIDSEKETKENK